jgi:hypothetical protein
VFPARYDLGFYIPKDGILHSHRRENFKSYLINSSFRYWEHCARDRSCDSVETETSAISQVTK